MVVPLRVQFPPVAVMTAFALAFVVAAMLKVDSYAAVAGAPVNVTVGVALVAVVDCVTCAAAV
jgi:hypothetical protein